MEKPVQFLHENKRLYGILHIPEKNISPGIVVTIIIGGSQTRIGSHRLYIQLARFLCSHGFAVFRFDYEGMGDSEGDLVLFEGVGPSLNTAIEFIVKQFNFSQIILWSICIGASAIALYIKDCDYPVSGLILCNPDVRCPSNEAKTRLKYYYMKRFLEKEFWKKIFLLKIDILDSFRSVTQDLREFFRNSDNASKSYANIHVDSIAEKVIDGIEGFKGSVDIILSSEDLIANSFVEDVKTRKKFKTIIKKKVAQHVIKGANHTFTEPHMRDEFFKKMLFIVQKIKNNVQL
jgi:uncharacterized protein